MLRFATFIFFLSLFVSCGTPNNGIFSKKTDHEKYADRVEDRLNKTPEGRQWLAAAELAVSNPYQVKLPYKQHGLFMQNNPRAMGLQFFGNAGEQLRFSLTKKSNSSFSIFADLFEQEGLSSSLVFSADTSMAEFVVNIHQSGNYILRLQPRLQQTGEYSISVAVGPSLEYPVPGAKARVGSLWGAPRDGGKRSHEGIDIFAPKKTPVIASADGVITSVRDQGIGGKTIWLRPSDRNISLYYAHLDSQLVSPGQSVKAGETIGTVGNTGNAKSTPPHLHFGVYSYAGPVDPLPYVNKSVKQPAGFSKLSFDKLLKTKKTHTAPGGEVIPANSILLPVAVDAKGYLTELPGGQLFSIPAAAVKTIDQQDVAIYENLGSKDAGESSENPRN